MNEDLPGMKRLRSAKQIVAKSRLEEKPVPKGTYLEHTKASIAKTTQPKACTLKREVVIQNNKLAKLNIFPIKTPKRMEPSMSSPCSIQPQQVKSRRNSQGSLADSDGIRLTEFVPTQLKLKRDLSKRISRAINKTVTTVSPTGSVVSNIKTCSVVSKTTLNADLK